jgi:hypothetical protein
MHRPRTQNRGLYAVAYTDTLLATACRDANCHLLCAATRREKAKLAGHRGEVNDIDFSMDGALASVSDDKSCICA